MTAECLRVYLLGRVDYADAQRFVRRLAYDVSGEPDQGALVLCEHPPTISVGREGSRADIGFEPAELRSREWPVRWVGRGGGAILHLPGQLAVYPVLALGQFCLRPGDFLVALHKIMVEVVEAYGVPAALQPGRPGVWAGDRRVAAIGVAVRNGATTHGAYLNVCPDLDPFRRVAAAGELPMTSLERERRLPARPALARHLLLDAFAERFGFARHALFHSIPPGPTRTHAIPPVAR